MQAGEVVLEVRNVSLAFGGVRALAGVGFDVVKGEIRAIIGPNGAGKSSMLNVINGVYHPQEGEIVFKGVVRREVEEWMQEHEWSSLGEMRGNMSLERIPDPAAYERANFRMSLR